MSATDRDIARFVERQMRNWELGHQHAPSAGPTEATGAIHFYIALSRELGSPGEEVAECLSQCLGWPKYDREILEYMSEHEETRRRLYETLDERQRNWLQQLIDLLEPLGVDASRTRDEYFHRLGRAVIAIAQQQHAIFVGRGVNFILPRGKGLAVRIVAPLADRVGHLEQAEGLSQRAARRRIQEVEGQRADFLVKHFGSRPYDPRRYDLVLNAASLSVQDMCDLVRLAGERKSGRALPCQKVPATVH